ncbi:MAG TPA: MFS transporter [Anaerolineales bacterium]
MGHKPAQDSSLSAETNQHGNPSRAAGYYAAYVALGLVTASLGPTLPGLAEHTSVSLSTAGLLFTTRSLGFTLGSLYIGRSYDRFPGHRVMAGMLLLMTGMLVLAPTTTLFWVLALVMFLLGAGEGTLDVGGNTLLVWLMREEVGPFMNAMHFFFGAGAFFSPVIIAQALEISGDITWAYWALAFLVAPIALWLLRVPSPSAPNGDDKDTKGELRPWLVFLVAAFFFLYVGAEAGYGGWVFTYAKSADFGGLNLTDATAAYLTSAFWGALTLGRLFSIPMAARLRPSVILFADLAGCLLSVGIILLWPASELALWAGSIGLGLFMASIFPITIAFAERRMPISGRITGFFFVGVGTGAMTVPWLVGQLFESLGPQALLYTLTAVLLLGVGVLASLLISSSSRLASPSG